jgi:NADH-quinone oxidoreductase subunit M
MALTGFPILSLVIFLPAAGAGLILLLPARRADLIRAVAVIVSVADFLLSVPLFFWFQAGRAEPQFVENLSWISSWGAYYHLGLDGLSLLLFLLTTFLSWVAILSSWTAIQQQVKGYMFFLLMLETGMLGVFAALDLFLFYVFWEAMLIPMYFLIGVWGGPRRVYATIKFVLFTMAGSVLMLVAIIWLYFAHQAQTGKATFDLLELLRTDLASTTQVWLFAAFGLAFAIKVPMFPFHTWLPDAHVEAPTAGSVVLAGVLLKMGTYGFLRFCLPLFPEAAVGLAPLIAVLAIIGVIYGALVSLVQRDIKKLVAYSSVSHLGLVMLGLFSFNVQGIEGGIIQMVNHGLSTGALFLLVGMLYERTHKRMIGDFGGLARIVPAFSAFFLIVMLSSIGVPGLNGFVGEFLIVLGAFRAKAVYGAAAVTAIILGAVYMLWMYQRVMHGEPASREQENLRDMRFREVAYMLPVAALMFLIGLYPKPFLARTEASVKQVIARVHNAQLKSVELREAKAVESGSARAKGAWRAD